MRSISRRALALGIGATIMLAPSVLRAQDESSTGADTSDLLDQMPGLIAAWARRYDNPDRHDHLPIQSTPVAADVTTRQLSLTVAEFDDAANTTIAFAYGLNLETAGIILNRDPATFAEPQELDLGDQGYLFLSTDDSGMAALIAAQRGNLACLATAWGPDDDVVGSVRAAASYMVDTTPGTDDIEFVFPADSHGGVFDLFPPRGDAALLGLVPMYEYDLTVSESPLEHPDGGATPAS